jgi:hypothetical protein
VLALATGGAPTPAKGRGRYRNAASFLLRAFDQARLKAFPDPTRIAALQRDYEDARLMVYVKRGAQLAREFKWLGRYRYAIFNLGAMSVAQLFERYHHIKRELAFEFA